MKVFFCLLLGLVFLRTGETVMADGQIDVVEAYECRSVMHSSKSSEQANNMPIKYAQATAVIVEADSRHGIGPTSFDREIISTAKGPAEVFNGKYDASSELYKSAVEGDADAQYELGVSYQQGIGCAKDSNEAFKWFSKSASQNYAKGLSALGRCYYLGRGVARDKAKGTELLKKSAERGDPGARLILLEIS
ncbi:MAG: hypothetical protein F2923_00250 [Actinobacteria bacterium]|uniref:Unannotated protein n=1 Tax=freshwater metagenome TaxID=449393 RepID=A0A6J7RXJ8_9ZZZZ|nr:hypothetical protein [Actinomycetota bacterium]